MLGQLRGAWSGGHLLVQTEQVLQSAHVGLMIGLRSVKMAHFVMYWVMKLGLKHGKAALMHVEHQWLHTMVQLQRRLAMMKRLLP